MSAINLPDSEILESQQSTWQTELQPVGCPHCSQAFLVESQRIGLTCPACGLGKLEQQPARLRPEPPELVIPFSQHGLNLNALYERFTQGVWLRPDDFNSQNLLRRSTPLYWPMWLVDSQVVGSWQAEIGYDYEVESSQDSYAGGQWRSKKVVETRIRWEPRLGQIEHHFDNISAPALSDNERLARILGPYRPEDAQAYQPQHLAGSIVRIPDLPPESAWPLAQSRLDQQAGQLCQQAAQGQHNRNFQIKAEYKDLNWTQLLQPLYVSYYTDDQGQPQFVYINPQTGQIGGRRLASQRKGWRWAGISLGLALLALIIGLIAFAASPMLPPLSLLGILASAAALALGIFAIVPAVWPWQWNRQQQAPKVFRN